MMRCLSCCMPPSKPDIFFKDGICSACISYAKRPQIDWAQRELELTQLLNRHNGRVIVPSSGGKDSTYIALRMKELGADVTAVTATTCHLTPIGRQNLDNLAKHVRTIEVTPNMTVRAKLNRLGLELVGDISWPEHASIFSVPFRVAKQMGISLLMYGENPQAEYGGPMGSDEARVMTKRWTSEFGGFLGLRPSDLIGDGISTSDMMDYMFPQDIGNIEAHFLGAYEAWDSHRNARVAIANGLRAEKPTPANWWDAENLDNAQTGLHDYMMYRKYGYGRGCAQISVDVRYGLISREDALEWVFERDGGFPNIYAGVSIAEVLARIGMHRKTLNEIINRYTNKDIFNARSENHPRHAVQGSAAGEGAEVRQ